MLTELVSLVDKETRHWTRATVSACKPTGNSIPRTWR